MANKIVLNIEGMSCKHCAAAVTKALTELKNVKKAVVKLEKKEAAVTLKGHIDNRELIAAVEEAGYRAGLKQ